MGSTTEGEAALQEPKIGWTNIQPEQVKLRFFQASANKEIAPDKEV